MLKNVFYIKYLINFKINRIRINRIKLIEKKIFWGSFGHFVQADKGNVTIVLNISAYNNKIERNPLRHYHLRIDRQRSDKKI